MVLGQKVTDIPVNKNIRDGNWNAGALRMKCIINGYCPFEQTPFSDHALIFNHETIESAPDYIGNNLSSVPGEIGVFLKEKHVYHSQYLFINCKALCADIGALSGSGESGGEEVIIHAAMESMRKEFVWDVTDHVFLKYGDIIVEPTKYDTEGSNDNVDPARWECKRENKKLESTDKKGDTGEASDSDVSYPIQSAASPYIQSGIHWRVRKRTPLFRGEDFFVELRRTTVSTDLVNRSGSAAFENTLDDDDIYRTLDITRCEIGDDGVPLNSGVVSYKYKKGKLEAIESSKELFDFTRQAYFIIEMGVGLNYRYCIIITQKSNPRFVKIVDKRSYFVSEYTVTTGDELFNNDTIKISIRNHLGKIVVIFNNDNNRPWIIGDFKTKEGSGSGAQQAGSSGNKPKTNKANSSNTAENETQDSYVIQTSEGVRIGAAYEGTKEEGYGNWIDESSNNPGSGADISTGDNGSGTDPASESTESTSTGDTGYQDNALCPATPPEEPKDPTDLFEVPQGLLALWGGNLGAGFLFSPIQYISHYSIPVPLPSKKIYDKTGKDTPIPLIVPGQTQILLSMRDMGLHTAKGEVLPRNPGKFKGDPTVRGGNKTPFYICDSHEVKEYGPQWRSGYIVRPSEFMDYGGFIKDERTGEKSKIYIEKQDAQIGKQSSVAPPDKDGLNWNEGLDLNWDEGLDMDLSGGDTGGGVAGVAQSILSGIGNAAIGAIETVGSIASSVLSNAGLMSGDSGTTEIRASTTSKDDLGSGIQGLGKNMKA